VHSQRRALAPRRALRSVLAGYVILSAAALLPVPALAAEGKPPVIESMGAGIGGEITVSAHIDPEGLETTYEIKLECGPGEPVPCDSIPNERSEGRLATGYEVHEVSLTLTGLQPGTYWFGAHARNSVGETSWSSDILTVPPPSPCPDGCPTPPIYESKQSQGAAEATKAYAEMAAARAEEKRHQEALEREESKAREAALHASEEAADKHRAEEEAAASKHLEEEEQKEATAAREANTCVVPALRGDTLNAARHALAKARCRLGKVIRPANNHSPLIVTRQSPRHGKRLPRGSAVAVTLTPRPQIGSNAYGRRAA